MTERFLGRDGRAAPTSPDSDAAAGSPGAVVAFGIDNLAAIEELFGSALADGIEEQVAERLQQLLPMGASMRRTGNRRFLFDLPQSTEAAAAALVQTVQAALAEHAMRTPMGPLAVTVSAGCACSDGDAAMADLDPPALHALLRATRAGVGSYRVARDDSALLAFRQRLMETSSAALGAVGTDSLTLAFQPVVRSGGTDMISFHECLVRLRQADGALLNAGAFMPAIEQLGLAPIIDRQVLKMCLETLIRHPAVRLSVNIFPSTIQDRRWLALLENAAHSDPTLIERLIVEITESAAMLDVTRTRTFMDRLRSFGVAFAIDDFGAGHTALVSLRDLRFDILKIDRRIVCGIDTNPDNRFLMQTLIGVARHFEMMSVAEGVETHQEARCLCDLDIDYFQGFRFGSPSLQLQPTSTPMPAAAAQA
ncbi:MAG: GGDEF domain-containing phosphodiesterase [Pseudomonadota bacterium]